MRQDQEESAQTRMWLMVGSGSSVAIGIGLFTAGSLWPLAGILAVAAGIATLFVTGGGLYFKALSMQRKLIAVPGLVVGCVVVAIGVVTVKVLLPIFKQDLLS